MNLSIRSALLSLICLLSSFVLEIHSQSPKNSSSPNQTATTDDRSKSRYDGIISGHVIGEDGEPVANAGVSIFDFNYSRGSSLTYTAVTTDEEGRFNFTGLPRGAYRLSANVPGYVVVRNQSSSADGLRFYRVGETATLNLVKGGVITGRVTDAQGEALVRVSVLAIRVRDSEGRSLSPRSAYGGRSQKTDDRGIYRFYGLEPGAYVVCTDLIMERIEYLEVRTCYPSSTRTTATEVTVGSGQEASGIDIRHRGESGHSMSGTFTGDFESRQSSSHVDVYLTNAETGQIEAYTYVYNSRNFLLNAVADGEYELIARRSGRFGDQPEVGASSLPRRVTIQGADLAGIELKLMKLGSITANVKSERGNSTNATCEEKGQFSFDEVVLSLRREEKEYRPLFNYSTTFRLRESQESVSKEQGEFTAQDLEPGRYRLKANLPSDNWYLRSITLMPNAPSKTQSAKGNQTANQIDIARNGLSLKQGEKITDLNVIIAEGAAALQGRVIPSTEEAKLPSRLRLHLIPAETASADDVLRYAETISANDGAFEFKHLAPGKYLLYARPLPENESSESPSRPAAWDAIERTRLRREAEAAKNQVELQPCQRVKSYPLKVKAP
ncbi:MAG: carboxypeptidase-like regulatory domain-containing protein [Acidobacteria bacterium]|nr:carboxypeptidase-like regulatory domain-containing protein [Acidobacteriota bacterium]